MIAASPNKTAAVVQTAQFAGAPQTVSTRMVAGATTTSVPGATYVGATLTGATTRVGTTQASGTTQFAGATTRVGTTQAGGITQVAGATTRAGYPAATTRLAGAPTIASALPQSARVNATAGFGTSTIVAGVAKAPTFATAGTQGRIITTPAVATVGAQARIVTAPAVATVGAQALITTAPAVATAGTQARFMTSTTMSAAAAPQVLKAVAVPQVQTVPQGYKASTIMPSPAVAVVNSGVVVGNAVAVANSGVVVGKAKVLSGGIAGIAPGGQIIVAQKLVTPVVVGGTTPVGIGGTTPGLAGPAASQQAYEAKHKNDPQLANLREVKKACQLKEVHVKVAADVFKAAAVDGKFTRDQFFAAHSKLLDSQGVSHPSDEVKNAVFDLFDRDDNGIVDMMEIVCGISLLCKGGDEEKVEAVFVMFDATGDGFITQAEMVLFLRTVFQVICTPAVMEAVNASGVQIDSMEDMASATAAECFETADVNHDGKLSLDEFKKWFYGERGHPDLLFEPVKQLLH